MESGKGVDSFPTCRTEYRGVVSADGFDSCVAKSALVQEGREGRGERGFGGRTDVSNPPHTTSASSPSRRVMSCIT